MKIYNQNIEGRFNKFQDKTLTKDITIDIFSESLLQYLHKLHAASKGRYELDYYDLQVIAIAMDQYANLLKEDSL